MTKINIPVYNCKVLVVFTNKFRKTGKKFKVNLGRGSDNNAGLAFKMNRNCTKYMILIKKKYRKDWDLLSHESLHIANFILDDRGVGVTLKNDEAQAYLLGFIMKRIQKGI